LARTSFDELRSRLGRRVLAALVTSALLPAAAGSAIAYVRARDELLAQGQERLQRSAKQLALTLYERLRQAEAQIPGQRGADTRVATPLELDSDVRGSLDPAERAHLAAGHSLLRTMHETPGDAGVLLIRGAPGTPSSLRAWRIRSEFLWRTPEENLLEVDDEFCVQDGHGLVLHCSEAALGGTAVAERSFATRIAGRAMLGTAWSIFLRPAFATSDWRVVLAQPRDAVLAPVRSLERAFPLLVALSLLVGLGLALPQIRRSLGPLQALTLGARRIAERDFEARVAIRSGDEFEALGDAFNGMAAELGRQFHALEAIGEIDRSVLAALDLREIARVVLEQLPRVVSAAPIGLILTPADAGNRVRVFRPAGAGQIVASEVELEAPALAWIDALEPEGGVASNHSRERALRSALETSQTRIRVVPLRAQGRLLGALALSGREVAADEAALRGLAGQIAVALWNARMIEEIRYFAYYDGLTGLANRQLGTERLHQALLQARRRNGQVAVLFLDLDRFKRVNDSLGHPAGDELLRRVGRKLSDTMRATDTVSRPGEADGSVSRLGGDEFVILLPEVRDLNGAASAARRLLEALRAPVSVQGRDIVISASIGIAMFPHDGDSADELLRNADAALYEAKRAGRDGFRFYHEMMNAEASRRLTVEARLRKAVETRELRVAYQPIVYPDVRRALGVEALVRWTDPELGPISPAELISVAEETGLIVALGAWILEAACSQAVAWEREGVGPLYVSVNASPRQVTSPGFARSVGETLQRTGLPPQRLVLEITETLVVSRAADPAHVLDELKALGVGLSIDDFGTGYSSLAYLKEFPLDFLKIDRCFVKEIGVGARDEAIVSAIVQLGHLLGLQVVAEGVETEGQLAFLRARGCDAIQGYLLGRPVPPDEVPAALARIRATLAASE
jgi:diguanylate cyclase (GGDEF)-like protein